MAEEAINYGRYKTRIGPHVHYFSTKLVTLFRANDGSDGVLSSKAIRLRILKSARFGLAERNQWFVQLGHSHNSTEPIVS